MKFFAKKNVLALIIVALSAFVCKAEDPDLVGAEAQEASVKFASGNMGRIGGVLTKLNLVLPSKTFNIFKGLSIQTPKFKPLRIEVGDTTTSVFSKSPGQYKGFRAYSDVTVGGAVGRLTIILANPVNNPTQQLIGVMLKLPDGWRLSDFDDSLAKLDNSLLPSGTIILSNFNYRDMLEGAKARKGVTVTVNMPVLSGKFAPVQDFMNKAQQMAGKGAIIGMEGVPQFTAHYGFQGGHWSADVALPLRIGWDFTKSGTLQPGHIKSITTNDFVAGAYFQGADFWIRLRAGVILELASQAEKLAFSAGVNLMPTGFELVGLMNGMYDPAFGFSWLGLGNFGMNIGVDYTAPTMLTGVPINKLAFRGDWRIDDIQAQFAAEASLSSRKPPGMVLHARVNDFHIKHMMWLVARAFNGSVKMENLPNAYLRNVEVYLANQLTWIGDKTYHRGAALKGEFGIGDFHGSVDFQVYPDIGKTVGKAYFMPIKTSFFTLTGTGFDAQLGTLDDGAVLDMEFLPGVPNKFLFSMLATIPPIGLSQEIKALKRGSVLAAKFETKLFNEIQVLLDANILLTPRTIENSSFTALFKSGEPIKKLLQEGLKGMRAELMSAEMRTPIKRSVTGSFWNKFKATMENVGESVKAGVFNVSYKVMGGLDRVVSTDAIDVHELSLTVQGSIIKERAVITLGRRRHVYQGQHNLADGWGNIQDGASLLNKMATNILRDIKKKMSQLF